MIIKLMTDVNVNNFQRRRCVWKAKVDAGTPDDSDDERNSSPKRRRPFSHSGATCRCWYLQTILILLKVDE